MVFVLWDEYGICRYWAQPSSSCFRGSQCRFRHPERDEIRRIVGDHVNAENRNERALPTPTHLPPTNDLPMYGQNHAPQRPPPGPVRAHDRLAYDPFRMSSAPGPVRANNEQQFGPRQIAAPPGVEGANDYLPYVRAQASSPPAPRLQLRGTEMRRLNNFESRQDVNAAQPLPKPRSRGRLQLPEDSGAVQSRPRTRDSFQDPPSSGMDYRWTQRGLTSSTPPTIPAHDTRSSSLSMPMQETLRSNPLRNTTEVMDNRSHSRHVFDPRDSYNPYVNGTKTYRFVWGEPLCVVCGAIGHLPKDCKGDALSSEEQRSLFMIMKEAQNRSKIERGREPLQPTSSSAEVPTTSIRTDPVVPSSPYMVREVSMLDVPPSPKAAHDEMSDVALSPKVSRRGGLESQSDYWKKYKARQLQRERSSLHNDNEMMSLDAEEAQTSGGESKYARRRAGKRERAAAAEQQAEQEQEHVVEAGQERCPPEHVTSPNITSEQTRQASASSERVLRGPSTAPPLLLQPDTADMVATKRMSNGEAKAVGPHPSTIRVSAPYITQAAIEKCLQLSTALDAQERSLAEAREDNVRLQGVTWLDNVRRALQLPIKTYTTACVYYHKFRLAHPTVEYSWSDAAAASLLTSCKNEDTLKKSRDILAAAYNLKQPANHEQVGADDPIFEQPSRVVIGLERLVLESGGFDFRSRSPHHSLIKIGKSLPPRDELKAVAQLAFTILTDLHRTFAPLKQTSSTLALASLELAANFMASNSPNNTCTVRDDLQALDINKWSTTREEVMETLLDALDLYTHHTASTILGTKYSLDDLLRIRLAFNKECSEAGLPRYTVARPPPSPDDGTNGTLRLTNGHPTPVSPQEPGTQAPPQSNGTIPRPSTPEGGGTLRFMLNPQSATEERAEVNRYYTEEWEEYEEEIEVQLPRNLSRERDRDRHRDHTPGRHTPGRPERERYRDDDRRSTREDWDLMRGPLIDRNRDRDSLTHRERDPERDRARLRDKDRERRYDDRRYDDRERDRRYDDRRDRDRDRDRRPYDDDRRRVRENR